MASIEFDDDVDEKLTSRYSRKEFVPSDDKDDNGTDLKVSMKTPSSTSIATTKIANAVILQPREKFAIYKVDVKISDDKKWVIHRRYSDFTSLNKKLKKLFPNIQLKLPPKRYFRNNFNQEFITKRQQGLQDFIANIFSLKTIYESVPVQKFFRINNPPDASEDLETCQTYCMGLETKVEDLKQLLRCKEVEMERMKEEMEEMSTSLNIKNEDSVRMTNSLFIDKSQLEQQLASLTFSITEKEKELQRMKDDYGRTDTQARKVRQKERETREELINNRRLTFIEKRHEIDLLLNDIFSSLSDIGKIKINIGGQNIDVKPVDNMSEKERELRQSLTECQTELENLYSEHVTHYQTELEESKVECSNAMTSLQSCQSEIERLNLHIQYMQQNFSNESNSKDILLRQYENQISTENNYIFNLEQKYFYSLFLGVKLNMALYGSLDDLMTTNVDPGKLFLEARENRVGIESWPSWVSKRLRMTLS